jgi:hypothetical protein
MSHFKITHDGIFTLTSVEEISVVDPTHMTFPAPPAPAQYHVYSFHVKAKIDPGISLTSVVSPVASAVTPSGIISQPMQKISGDPTNFFYKTTAPISFGGGVAYTLPIVATVKATFITTETVSGEGAPVTLP